MRYLVPLISLLPVLAWSAPNAERAEIRSSPSKTIDGVNEDVASSNHGAKGLFPRLLASLESIQPTATPTSIQDVLSKLASIHARSKASGYIEMTAELISAGITTNRLASMEDGLKSLNNPSNINTREPSTSIFPKKSREDAPYSQTEAQMRRQILIPSSFTFGKKPPTILVPGTGERGGNSFRNNFIKTLAGKDYADLVWINPPGYQLADAQTNAETVAYAINYISGISNNRNVSIIGWSQGNINTHWALKYWPSARRLTSVNIANSADYHGTVVANFITPIQGVPLPPSIFQQTYNSNFIKALRSNGGDSAYVPTTNIYSGFFDEIVEPQQGIGASGFLKDERGVGVTNAEIGKVCPSVSPAGVFATHESVLFNSLTHALANDALKHVGPASMDRVDLKTVCQRPGAPGLTLDDFLGTESTIPFAGFQIAVYKPKVFKEPAIRPYAI